MKDICNIGLIDNFAEAIEERKNEEFKRIGFNTHALLDKKPNVYELRAYYLTTCVKLRVDNKYIKSKGKRSVEKFLFPYLFVQIKKKYKMAIRDKVEFGYYKNNKKVKFESFCA